MSYQPTATTPGERECEDRWEPIEAVLSEMPEPFTVLDLGANAGWFTQRLVETFDCRVTAVDNHPDLAAIASDRVTVVNRRVTAKDLRAMSRDDVVLALSVLHHMADWRQALEQVRACRRWAFVETPDPGEKWMRSAAARHELRPIHTAVKAASTDCLGLSNRTGRDGSKHQRPLFLLPGVVETVKGAVFSGSGSCSRNLTAVRYAKGLDKELGYQPFPGSLNLRLDRPNGFLGEPAADWSGRVGSKRRPYQFWNAWLGGMALHVMIPGTRGWGPNHVELVAPVKLRDKYGLKDGDVVTVDVARGA